MSVSASRQIAIGFSGDISATNTFAAANNGAAPGSITIHSLTGPGDNTITVPGGGATVKGATIIPPAGNAQTITLKGVGGDTGIPLSKTDPTSLGFETAPANFILNAGGAIAGLRIVWT